MNIHEHQAKDILREFGAPVSDGVVINNFDHDTHHHLSESDNDSRLKESYYKRTIAGIKYGFLEEKFIIPVIFKTSVSSFKFFKPASVINPLLTSKYP